MMFDFDIEYSEEKNELLRKSRKICFEDVEEALKKDGFIDVVEHHRKSLYPSQKILVVRIKHYIYAVPFVYSATKGVVFLKTIYPDRKLTKRYLKK